MQYYLFKFLSYFFATARWFFLIILLIAAMGFLAPMIEDASSYPYMRHIIAIDNTMIETLRSYIPT